MRRAVSGSRADGANPFCGRLHGYRWTFVETILFTSEDEKGVGGFSTRIKAVYFHQHKNINYTFILTCWGCVFSCQPQGAPSAAQRSREKRPRWCLAGDARAGKGTGLGSAWLPVHSGAAPSAEGAGLPGKKRNW